jgi:hypothetical protein
MAECVLDFARGTKARIVLQQCGNAHVAGDDQMGWPARHSLSARLKAKGVPVLAMPILSPYFPASALPARHGLGARELHMIQPLPGAGPFEGARVNGWLKALGLPAERLSPRRYAESALGLRGAGGILTSFSEFRI